MTTNAALTHTPLKRIDILPDIKHLKAFIAPQQISAIAHAMRGEEGQYFIDKIREIADLIRDMPGAYEQDGLGDEAIVYLHYFYGSGDWFITEKDDDRLAALCGKEIDDNSTKQHQAFGFVDIGYGGELGYISIAELIAHDIELDLHWTPRTLREIKAERA